MRALLLASLLASGCSAALNFRECNQDADCAVRKTDGGTAFFCTNDHLCVGALPEERLCTGGMFGAQPGPSTTMVAGLFRLSGDAGDKDVEMAQAAELAMMEVNTVGQRPIGMVLCDIQGDGVADRSLRKAITQYHIVGAIGPTTSGSVIQVVNTARDNNVLIVSPSATSPSITTLQDNGLVWRTAASDTLQSKVLAQIIPLTVGTGTPTKVDTAYANSTYGIGLNQAFFDAWSMRAGRAPVQTVQYEEGSDPAPTVAKLANDKPDYSVIVADADAAKIIAALGSAPSGLSAAKFLFTDGAKGPDLLANPNPNVLSRVSGTGPATPSGVVYEAFAASYMGHFNSDPAATAFVANAYDAAYAISLCIAGTPTGNALNGGVLAGVMARLSGPGTAVNVGPNGFNAGAATLSSGGGITLNGTSSHLTWDPATGDLVSAPIEVWTIDLTDPQRPTFKTIMTIVP